MAYKNYKNNKFKNKNSKTQPDSDLVYGGPQNGGPVEKRNYEANPEFEKKMFRDLSFDSFTTKLDPTGAMLVLSDPYGILGKTNQIVDAKYTGSPTWNGSICYQLVNGQTSSFKNIPDMVTENLNINYLFCKVTSGSNADTIQITTSEPNPDYDPDDPGSSEYIDVTHTYGSMNFKMGEPFDEILSTIASQAYYDLPFFKWQVAEGSTVYSPDGLIDVMLNYQSIVQAVGTVPTKFRAIRSLEKHLKDMCYMNGASTMNSLYGRLHKASLCNAMKSVSESLIPHFMDTAWFNQVSMLVAIPCRRTRGMITPLIDIIPHYKINTELKVVDGEGNTIVDFAQFQSLIDSVNSVLYEISPDRVLGLARNPATVYSDIINWSNTIEDDLLNIVLYMTKFQTAFKEMLVAFKRLAQAGFTEWKTGQFIDLHNMEEAYEPKFNKLIHDIVRCSFTGSKTIKYDTRVNNWKFLDLLDQYVGMPTYDYYEGGAILTFSAHVIDKTGAPTTVNAPGLFYGTSVTGSGGATVDNKPVLKVRTRENNIFYINWAAGDFTSTVGPKVLSRLVPLTSLDSEEFIYPVVDISSIAGDSKSQSWIQTMMVQLFGYSAAIVDYDNTDPDNPVPVYNYQVNQDALCFMDGQFPDLSNKMETFARQHSPFRVIKTTLDNQLGFSTSRK